MVGTSAFRRTALASALVLPFVPALAQEGGRVLTFGIDQRFETDDNIDLDVESPGTTNRSITTLSFRFAEETAVQDFLLEGDVGLVLGDGPNIADNDTDGPNVLLSYERESAGALLDVEAFYRESNISDFDPLTNTVDGLLPEDFETLTGTGRRLSYGASLDLELGRNDPVGFLFSAAANSLDYQDASDPTLYDSERWDASGAFRLDLGPGLTGRLGASVEQYNEDNPEQTDRTTETVDFGLTYELSERATIEAVLGYTTVDTTEFGLLETEDGVNGLLGLTYAMPNGTLSATYDSVINQDGKRYNLVFGRSLELPRGGAFEGEIGATQIEDEDPELIGLLSWSQELPRGAISANIARDVETDSNDDDRLRTSAGIGYSQALSDVSSFDLGLDYGYSAPTETEEDVRATTFSASYNHALTADWGMTLGYRYRTREEGDEGQAVSNTVFLSVGREFSLRP